jgi:hypothetical protein
LTPVERAAPAFVSCLRALAAGSFDRAEDALEAITEAAGAAGLDPARIRARQRLRLRAQQARPLRLDLGSVDESPSPTSPTRPFLDKWRSPGPLALASVATVGLVAAYGVLGALLPEQPSAPRAGTPDQAVRMVFDLSAQHRYSDAAGLRSAHLQAADPTGRSLRNRFAAAGEVELVEERVVALDAVHGRATVEVVWTERSAGGTRRLSGLVYLVNSRSGWLWDGGTVA